MAEGEFKRALKEVIDNESKTECREFIFEYYKPIPSVTQLDLTSAVLTHARDSNELSFSRFLSGDFTRCPYVLVSKMRRMSATEDKFFQSTPMGFRDNEILSYIKPSYSCTPQSQKSNSTENKDISDVWGSPLKCSIPAGDESGLLSMDSSQMSLGMKKSRSQHLGIPLNWARKITSIFNYSNISNGETDLPALVILCDGGDSHHSALLGVKPFQGLKGGQLAKGVKTVTITVDEKGSIESWNKQIKMGAGLSQACQAVYQVNAGEADREKPWGTVTVEIKWKGANHLLESPTSEASTTCVKASVQSGNIQSSMNTYYKELQFLGRIITAVTTGQVEWVSSGSEKTKISLTASVKNLIDTLQEEWTISSTKTKGTEQAETWTSATAMKTFNIPDRKDHDFTDRLWKVLVDCISTDDLVSCLRLVFNALGHGELRPFVERHNQTTVAQIVRECFTGRFSAPSLTGIQPFLFLSEMGAEKLRRDYIHIFVSHSLATPSDLENFTSTEKDLHAKMEGLHKLHSVLEMVTVLGASLRLPTNTLGIIARQMLSYYLHNPVNPQHVFSFSVKTSEVRYVLSSVKPVTWCLETTTNVSAMENARETSLHCLSRSQPFSHLQAHKKKSSGCKMDNSNDKQETGIIFSPLDDLQRDYCLVHRKESVFIL